jgi:crotonobetainyl-CoA:carnitine CoA-transferase CaiB-like acyl-CoA transferase
VRVDLDETRLPLVGLRVAEVDGDLSLAYATRLLVDLGATAVVLDATRPSHPVRCSEARLAHLRLECTRTVVDFDRPDAPELTQRLVAGSDIVLTTATIELPDSAARVVVRVCDIGLGQPIVGTNTTGLVLQARAGWSRRLAGPDRTPIFVGGDVDAYITGVHVAVAALTALAETCRVDQTVTATVSALEAMVTMLPFPTVHAQVLRDAGMPVPHFTPSLPGIVRCDDGWIGINPLNQQGWNDMCAVLRLDELRDRLREALGDTSVADRFRSAIAERVADRRRQEIVDLMQSIRVPAAAVADGASLLADPHLRSREAFVHVPGHECIAPRPPWRFSAPVPHDARSSDRDGVASQDTPNETATGSSWQGGRSGLPFSGLRVLDLTMYWAGPLVTSYLASFGADVIKVESRNRPDPFRYSTSSPDLGADWWERSAVWQAANLAKRSLTLDLSTEAGRALARRLAGEAEVLIENFTPRVLDHLGLEPASLQVANPSLVVLRMPAFGLSGPARDHVAWAPTFEQASGLADLARSDEGVPVPPGGCADPIAGMHALVGLQAALHQRARTGCGQIIEMAQLEALLGVTGEQIIRASLAGAYVEHETHAVVNGFFACAQPDTWIAIEADQRSWPALASVLGRPELVDDVHASQSIDEAVAAWSRMQDAAHARAVLEACGVRCAPAVWAADVADDPYLVQDAFFERVDRPATATYAYPRWPMRFSFGPERHHIAPAPTLGQHTDEILGSILGLSDEKIAELAAARVT